MSPSPTRARHARRHLPFGRGRRALVAAACALVALPSAAHAADPSRFIGIGTDGTRTQYLVPVAASNDGTEILADFDGRYPVIRDVAAGVTRDILHANDVVLDASADLKRIAFFSYERLVPGDTNDVQDLYMWDRPSNTYALVSRDLEGKSLLSGNDDPNIGLQVQNVAMSNLGTAIVFTLERHVFDFPKDTFTSYRYEASRSYTVKVSDERINEKTIGDNGTVLVDAKEVIAPSGRYPLPASIFTNTQVVTSANGNFVAWPSDGTSKITGVDTTNGRSATISIPKWLQDNGYELEGIADDASSITVSGLLEANKRFGYARIDRSGNVRQIGSDIPLTQATNPIFPHRLSVLAPNGQFAVTSLSLVKLGSLPLPGSEPTAPSTAAAADYFVLNDYNCPGFTTGPAGKPQLTLRKTAFGSDLRLPVRATAKAWKDGSPTISNDMALSPGQTKALWVGIEGGYRVDVTVTLAGGQVLTGSLRVDSHPAVRCGGF